MVGSSVVEKIRKGRRERFIFFFFKQKTAYEIYQCDWSSDVCSSDLLTIDGEEIKQDEPIGIYPATGESIFIKTGRFGH